jgi:hypothetical protein
LGRIDSYALVLHFRYNQPQRSASDHPSRVLLRFVSVGLAFQVAFIVIAGDPVRLRPMMIPSVLEKFGYGATLLVLYLQNRLHPQDLALGGVDMLFGVLFLIAYFKTGS